MSTVYSPFQTDAQGNQWQLVSGQWIPRRSAVAAPPSGQSGPSMAQAGPAGSLVGAGGARPWSDRIILADVVQEIDGDDGTNGTARARVVVPHPGLIVGMTLGFELVTPAVISTYNSATWSASLLRPAPEKGGRESELHTLWSSETLPQGRVVGGLYGLVAISAALQIPTAAGTGAPGQWVLEVQMIPAYPMCPEDVAAIYSQCAIRPVRKLLLDIAEA